MISTCKSPPQCGSGECEPDETCFSDYVVLCCSIPLAKKLEECGVFGVSSHEYRQYALANREEWVAKGQQIVADMKAKYSSNEPPMEKLQPEAGLPMKRSSMRSRETFRNEPKEQQQQVSGQSLDTFQNEIVS